MTLAAKATVIALSLFIAVGCAHAEPLLYGPVSAQHTRLLQTFQVGTERRNWIASYRSKPTDYVLLVAWHVARRTCRCVTAAQREASRRWLNARGLRCVRFNVYNAKLIIP